MLLLLLTAKAHTVWKSGVCVTHVLLEGSGCVDWAHTEASHAVSHATVMHTK